jgi:hypothetical protein
MKQQHVHWDGVVIQEFWQLGHMWLRSICGRSLGRGLICDGSAFNNVVCGKTAAALAFCSYASMLADTLNACVAAAFAYRFLRLWSHADDRAGLQLLYLFLCWLFSLMTGLWYFHMLLQLLCSQMAEPPSLLQVLYGRLCSQVTKPRQLLHVLLVRLLARRFPRRRILGTSNHRASSGRASTGPAYHCGMALTLRDRVH